ASTEQVAADRFEPTIRSRVGDDAPQAGQRQGEGVLRDRRGVDALAARPDEPRVEVVDERFDTGIRKLDPPCARRAGVHLGIPLRSLWISPDQGLGFGEWTDSRTRLAYGVDERRVHSRS